MQNKDIFLTNKKKKSVLKKQEQKANKYKQHYTEDDYENDSEISDRIRGAAIERR